MGISGRCPLCETIEIHRVLRRQEDYITNNRNSIFSITSRMHSQEEARNYEVTFILKTLHKSKETN
jgi:hypothetical protein